MTREPESLRHEADYWQALLRDLKDAHDAIGEVADAFARVSLATVELLPHTIAIPDAWPTVEKLGTLARTGMASLTGAQGSLMRIGDLAGGRALAMQRELNGDTAEGAS